MGTQQMMSLTPREQTPVEDPALHSITFRRVKFSDSSSFVFHAVKFHSEENVMWDKIATERLPKQSPLFLNFKYCLQRNDRHLCSQQFQVQYFYENILGTLAHYCEKVIGKKGDVSYTLLLRWVTQAVQAMATAGKQNQIYERFPTHALLISQDGQQLKVLHPGTLHRLPGLSSIATPDSLSDYERKNIFRLGVIFANICRSQPLDSPVSCQAIEGKPYPKEFILLLQDCIKMNPDQRPDLASIEARLGDLLRSHQRQSQRQLQAKSYRIMN